MESSAWGGSEELWAQAALRLRDRGHTVDVSVKSWRPESPRVSALQSAGCVIHPRGPRDRSFRARVSRRVSGDPWYGWLDRFGAGLIIISQGNNSDGVPWALQCVKRGIRYVLISQAVWECYWPDDDSAAVMQTAFTHAEANYFVSHSNLDVTARQLAIPLPNSKVVRNPYNVPYIADLPWPSEERGFRLACVARLEPKAKGQDLLIEVLSQEKWKARPVELTLWGTGCNEQMLGELVRHRGAKVLIGGHEPDVTQIWRKHHLLVLPSRFEGLPLALVEAMLCGRPSVVTDVAGNREMVDDNRTGFIAAGPTLACVDEALERAWARRNQWEAMGRDAKAAARTLVPADPVLVMAAELEHIAGSTARAK